MESVRDNELKAFFAYVVDVLERIGIPYMVVGGFAAIFYGEPRLTLDVDVVADIRLQHIKPLLEAFPMPQYYASEDAIRDALARRYPFNIIQPSTGAKVDIVPLPQDLFTRLAFQRRQRLEFDAQGRSADFITMEDIVLAKLIAHRETGSEKHLRDARGILLLQWEGLELGVIRRRAQATGVLAALERLVEVIQRDLEE